MYKYYRKVTFYLLDESTREFYWSQNRGNSEVWGEINGMIVRGIPDNDDTYIMPSQIKKWKFEKIEGDIPT